MLNVQINGTSDAALPDFTPFAKTILAEKGVQAGSFTFTLVDEDEIMRINQAYLNRDYITDIISFNLAEDEEDPIADIYICLDQAQDNANHYQKSLESELKLLIIHGILHTLGYEDYSPEDRANMEAEQDRLLALHP